VILRLAIATLLLLHGVVHLIGFLVPWRLMTPAPAGPAAPAGPTRP
jgi:hypothetical protein